MRLFTTVKAGMTYRSPCGYGIGCDLNGQNTFGKYFWDVDSEQWVLGVFKVSLFPQLWALTKPFSAPRLNRVPTHPIPLQKNLVLVP